MKILTVIENYNPFIMGGAEVTVESYINHISSEYSVTYQVLTGEHTKIKNFASLTHVNRKLIGVEGKKLNFLYELYTIIHNLLVLEWCLYTFKPNIIEFVPNNYSFYPLIFWSTLNRYPMLISVHNNSFSEIVPSIGGWLEKLKNKIINYMNDSQHTVVITISHYMKENLISAGFDENRIAVLNNPIERIYGKSSSQNYAVFASRLVKEKGVEFVLKAFSLMPEIELKVFGDGEEKALVEKYVRDFPNIFFYGKVSEDEVLTSIRKSLFIVAHPIFEEPFGRYIVHSFSTLKPLICTFSGAVSEMIHDNYTGLLIQKYDVKGLVNAVHQLMHDKLLYNKIVSNLEKEREKHLIGKIAKIRLEILSQKL